MSDKRREYYTLRDRDVGRNWLLAFGRTWLVSDFMGRILPTDVGKRAYQRGDVLQVENDDQRSRRLGGWPPCECGDTHCLNADGHNVPAGRLMDEDCGQHAVMHLFQVAMMVHETPLVEGQPVDFCDPCGDNALRSGLFATGEDVAAARRNPDCAGHHCERSHQ
jgi:hypothetical protein